MNETVAGVLARLKGVRPSGEGHLALCPAHDDSNPSLRVSEGSDGRVVMHCFAGCAVEDVVTALGLSMRELHPEPAGFRDRAARRLVAEYDYPDEDGVLLYQVVRYEPKAFSQRRPAGLNGWEWRLGDVRRVLYRLPEVMEAVAEKRTVYVVEGEKDADALGSLGLTATTNPSGAGKWRPEYSETLRGANVVVLPDNDETGRDHARGVAQSLVGIAGEVHVVELPGLAHKGDVSDWLAADGTREALEELVAAAPLWDGTQLPLAPDLSPITEEGSSAEPARRRFRLLSEADLDALPEREWLVEGVVPLGGLVVVYGPPASGKTFGVVGLACSVAAGRPWHGHAVKEGRAVIVAEGTSGLKSRIRAWRSHHGVPSADGVRFLPVPVQLLDDGHVDDLLAELRRLPTEPLLVVFDTLPRCLLGGDENSARDLGLVIEAAGRVQRETGATVILVHHPAKGPRGADTERGSSALRGAADAMLHFSMKKAKHGSRKTVTIRSAKMKDAPDFEDIVLSLVPTDGSAVLVEGADEERPAIEQLTEGQRQTLHALHRGSALTFTEWYLLSNQSKSTFDEHRKRLLGLGFVVQREDGRYTRVDVEEKKAS